jgi:hypothetical protein
MSLDWNITKLKDAESIFVHDDEGNRKRMDPTYESIIFYTMIVGIGEITEANKDEFFARVALHEKLFGAVVTMPGEDGKVIDVFTTPEDIEHMVGLNTNVWPKETEAKWLKRTAGRFLKDQRQIATKKLETVN